METIFDLCVIVLGLFNCGSFPAVHWSSVSGSYLSSRIMINVILVASGATQIGSSVSISCYITLGSRMGRSNFARR
jgi:hypothetical protein